MGKKMLSALITGLAAANAATMPAIAEPAGVEPRRTSGAGVPIGSPKTLRTFTVNGQQMSVVAYSRRARADTAYQRRHVEASKAMDKVMPGYPQPAVMTLDVKFWF